MTPTLCMTSNAVYIWPHPLLSSSHYCTYDSTTSIYETTSSMQGNIYTIHVTSQPVIWVITPTVLTMSPPLFVCLHTWHMYSIYCTVEENPSSHYDIKPQFLRHHTQYIWHRINGICVITSTVLMISYHLYLWDLIDYVWRHHIHCIKHHIHSICSIAETVSVSHKQSFHHITTLVCMTSQQLDVYHHIHYIRHHIHILWDHTTFLLTANALYSWYHSHYLTLHPLYLCHHNHSIDDLWTTVYMTSHPVYVWQFMHYT